MEPTKKKKRQRYSNSTTCQIAPDDMCRAQASLVERASCVLGRSQYDTPEGWGLRDNSVTIITDMRLRLPSELQCVLPDNSVTIITDMRLRLPSELQCLPQYWLAKVYISAYKTLVAVCYEGTLPQTNYRNTTDWLLNKDNSPIPACVVEGFRWLEWKTYQDALKGPRFANHWVYLSPMSKNILIHGYKYHYPDGFDSRHTYINICIRQGTAQPWIQKWRFNYHIKNSAYSAFCENRNHSCGIEILCFAGADKSVWPFSFPLPAPSIRGESKYILHGSSFDVPLNTPFIIYFFDGEVRPIKQPYGDTNIKNNITIGYGREAMLWFRWIIGREPPQKEGVQQRQQLIEYPWPEAIVFPNFRNAEDRLAKKARWKHAVVMLDKKETTKKLASFQADL